MGAQGEIVRRIMARWPDGVEESMRLLRPDAEWIPGPGRPSVRGLEAIQAQLADELERIGPCMPELAPEMLFERDGVVLVCGHVRYTRTRSEWSYVEVRPTAWLYEFDGELIARVVVFDDWNLARATAAFAQELPPTSTMRGEG